MHFLNDWENMCMIEVQFRINVGQILFAISKNKIKTDVGQSSAISRVHHEQEQCALDVG